MMRWLLGIVAVVCLFWFGYWFAGQRLITREVDRVFATPPAGLVLEKASSHVQGFPNRFDLILQDVSVADATTGAGYDAPYLSVFAMFWKPWHIIAALPPEQVLRLPGGETVAITGTDLKISLRAAPSTDLPLAEARIAGRQVALVSGAGWQTGAADVTLALAASATGVADYALGVNAKGVGIDPAFHARLMAQSLPDLPASDLPAELGPVTANVLIKLTAPIDRYVGQARPRVTGAEIGTLRIEWGAMVAEATGTIGADAAGFAEGRIELTLTNWDRLPALLVAMGTVKPEIAPTVASAMRALAGQSGDATVLRLPLILADGDMSLGPFPLGPAPMLVSPQG